MTDPRSPHLGVPHVRSAHLRAALVDPGTVERLDQVLHEESRLLERLVYRLSQLAMLAAAEEHRFLARAMDEVDDIRQDLATVELVRAVVVAGLGAELGIEDPEPTLERIVDALTGPARDRLVARRATLRGLVAEAEAAQHEAERWIGERMAEVRRATTRLVNTGTTGAYART